MQQQFDFGADDGGFDPGLMAPDAALHMAGGGRRRAGVLLQRLWGSCGDSLSLLLHGVQGAHSAQLKEYGQEILKCEPWRGMTLAMDVLFQKVLLAPSIKTPDHNGDFVAAAAVTPKQAELASTTMAAFAERQTFGGRTAEAAEQLAAQLQVLYTAAVYSTSSV